MHGTVAKVWRFSGVMVCQTCAVIGLGGWDEIMPGLRQQLEGPSICQCPISPLWFLHNSAASGKVRKIGIQPLFYLRGFDHNPLLSAWQGTIVTI